MHRHLILALGALSLVLTLADTALAQNGVSQSPMTSATDLPLERLYAAPSLTGPRPEGVKYSPDGKRVTYIKARSDEAGRYDLWQFDVATGTESLLVDSKLLEPEEVELSEEEKALRERKRIAGRKGIVSYEWGTSDTLLVPLGGDLHLVTLTDAGLEARQLTATDAFEYDAKVSPRGNYVSFVREGAVYIIDLKTGEERRVTPPADPDAAISYGVAEFVAQEEMSRYTGYWWGPDEQYIAFTRVDESTVDIIPRFDIAAEDVTVIEQRYPRAGRPNAVVDVYVTDLTTNRLTEIVWRRDDWGPATDQYLARVAIKYSPDEGRALYLTRVDRDQTLLDVAEVPLVPETMLSADENILFAHSVWTETHATWINLNNDWSSHPGFFLTTAEASKGPRQIVKLAGSGAPAQTLTPNSGTVSAINYVDRTGDSIYFSGHFDSPLERHLYSVPLAGGTPSRMTEAGKSWSVRFAPDGQSYVGTSSSPDQPPQTGLYAVSGELITWIEENALNETHPYFPYLGRHTIPDYGTLTAEDGQTLHYSLQTPPDFDASKTYPVLVNVYGGPGVQTVDRDWERWDDQFYTRQGYIVFRLDNRGSANRDKAFEDVIYRTTGDPEVADQLRGVAWLKQQSFVDPDRIAIQGWSYGGYMTLMTLLQAPEGTFAAAVSGAPVTDWSLYDTFYTERYMDTPQDNADGYARSSVFYHLERFKGQLPELLLIHGMADDNVTFDNTTRLMAELQARGLLFDLMTYPGQRHGIRGEALRIHLMRTRMQFLNRHLNPQ